MNKILGHLKTVLRHKYYVFKYCLKLGIPWQGITHDLSKFSPCEFLESIKYYTGDMSPINNCKSKNGGLSMAWIHHRGRNLHHYEAWIDNFDSGFPIAHKMPWKYVLELVADYLAAGKTYDPRGFSFRSEYEWWMKKSNNCFMHRDTKNIITEIFMILDTYGEELGFDMIKKLKSLYMK